MPTKEQDENFMSSSRRDKRSIANKKRTSSCATGLRNLGASAKEKRSSSCATDGEDGVCHNGQDDIHDDGNNGKEDDDLVFEVDSDSDQDDDLLFDVDGDSDNEGDVGGYDGPCLPNRPERKFLPSQRQAMLLLSMAVPPEDRAHFKERYHAFATGKETSPCPLAGTTRKVCNTNVAWIAAAYGCDFVHQLQCAADMFPFSGMQSCFLSEIYVMDVILNRSPLMKTEPSAELPTKKAASSVVGGEDDVLLVRSYHEDDLDDKNDFKFRTMILFLPQCGVFYCARERRKEDVGVAKTHVALDMSWLRLERSTDSNGKVSYTFGKGGYVKRFHMEEPKQFRYLEYRGYSCGRFDEFVDRVSAWRISLNLTKDLQQNRVVYRVEQCRDSDGPKVAPDVFDGSWQPDIPREYLAVEYNQRLAVANSARRDGRHYAAGCHHYRLPDTCWIIDPASEHFVDIMVDLPCLGQQRNRQSVIMVRNVNFLTDDGGEDLLEAMACITKHNKTLRLAKKKGAARSNAGDYGTMHAIGTHVHLDGVTTSAYKANEAVGEALIREMVVSLVVIGRCAFPQVYAVIRDTEGNCGLHPVVPMDGEGGRRVGYTVDTSVDLGNASHYDFNDASQGYSQFLEDIPGKGTNWYLVMPNIHGRRPGPNSTWVPFAGLAIKITNGVAVSWDGRDIRHCTSVSEPDGPPVEGAAGDWAGSVRHTENHLYGTFTAAKERVVDAGRKMSAAMAVDRPERPNPAAAAIASGDLEESSMPATSAKKRRRRQKVRKRLRRRHSHVAYEAADDNDDDDDEDDGGVVPKFTEPLLPVKSPHATTYRIPKMIR